MIIIIMQQGQLFIQITQLKYLNLKKNKETVLKLAFVILNGLFFVTCKAYPSKMPQT